MHAGCVGSAVPPRWCCAAARRRPHARTARHHLPLWSWHLPDPARCLRSARAGRPPSAQGGPECQHGPAECRLNRLINCAAELRPEQTAWFPFVRCLADSVGIRSVEGEVGSCAAGAGIDADALRACAEGPAGAALEAAAEKETAKLDPPHQGVPWVTVNGITIGDDTDLLWRYICIAYTGPRPKTCFRPPPEDSNGHHSGRHGGRFELSAGLVGGVAGVVALAGVLAWGAARSADALRRRRQQGSDAEASLLVEPAVSFSIPDHTAAGPPPGRALRSHSLHMPGPGSYRTLRLPP